VQALANLRQQQASSLASFDVFWVPAVVMLALVFVVHLMKCSVTEKGARIRIRITCRRGRERVNVRFRRRLIGLLPTDFSRQAKFVTAPANSSGAVPTAPAIISTPVGSAPQPGFQLQ